MTTHLTRTQPRRLAHVYTYFFALCDGIWDLYSHLLTKCLPIRQFVTGMVAEGMALQLTPQRFDTLFSHPTHSSPLQLRKTLELDIKRSFPILREPSEARKVGHCCSDPLAAQCS